MRVVHVTGSAIPPVARIKDFIEVEYPPAPVNREVSGQLFSGVNSVNHESKIDGSRRHIHGAALGLLWNIYSRRIMAHDAVAGVVSATAMQRQSLVTDVALGIDIHYFPAWQHRAAIH
jgi:hypothetical protein